MSTISSNFLPSNYRWRKSRRYGNKNISSDKEIDIPLPPDEKSIEIALPNLPSDKSDDVRFFSFFSGYTEEILIIALIVLLLIEGCDDILLILALGFILLA